MTDEIHDAAIDAVCTPRNIQCVFKKVTSVQKYYLNPKRQNICQKETKFLTNTIHYGFDC